MLKERRLHPRITAAGFVSMSVAEDTVAVNLMNISPQGLQVEMTQSDMTLLSNHRSSDGTWPEVVIRFGATDPDPSLAGMCLTSELIFARRLSQNAYVAGFGFVAPDPVITQTIQAVVQTRS